MMTKQRKVTAKMAKAYRAFDGANGWSEAAAAGFDLAQSADPTALGVLADWCQEHPDGRIQDAADYFRAVGDVCDRLHRGFPVDAWFRWTLRAESARWDLVEHTIRATGPGGDGWVTDTRVMVRLDDAGRRKLHRVATAHRAKEGPGHERVIPRQASESILSLAQNRVKYGVPVESPSAVVYEHDGGRENARFDWPGGAGRTWVDFRYYQLVRSQHPRATAVIHTKEGQHWPVAFVDRVGDVQAIVIPLIR